MQDLRYLALEAFLLRWSARPDLAGEMVLRGSLLTRQFVRPLHRSAKDLDLLATFERDISRTDNFVRQILAQPADDGLYIDLERLSIEDTWTNHERPGRRYFVDVILPKASVNIQIDIAFGDTIYPAPISLDYLTSEGRILAVSAVAPELMLAWKVHGLFEFWAVNFRWLAKDLYDVFLLHQTNIDRDLFAACLRLAFEDKKTPMRVFSNFMRPEFGQSAKTRRHWAKFLETMAHQLIETDHLKIVAALRIWLRPFFAEALKESPQQ